MIGYLKDFILNIFILFSPLVFYPYIYRTKSNRIVYRLLLYILFSFALIMTMSVPVNLNGLIYDFRSIPITIGSLYGGAYVSIGLYITLLLWRYVMGNPNMMLYAVSILPSLLVMILVLKKYASFKWAHKMLFSVLLCTLIKLVTFMSYLTMTGQIELLWSNPVTTIGTYVLQAVIAALCVVLIEFLMQYFRMQEEVIQSEKMRIVSEMAASVAHEIRNPLTTVRGFLQLIGEANIQEEKKYFYQRVSLEELDRAQSIISDYLSLAKPDPEVIENINVNDEISYLTNVLLTYGNYNHIHIAGVSAEQALFITGDRQKFRQAVINIGKNAIEAMQDGGHLEIKAEREKRRVILRIKDTGVGMTEEQIQRLGTPYYSTKEKGTGLGTMVSFGIIRKMNGKIDIHSVLGEGTEYTLSFPEVTTMDEHG
ncbi:ATP-binding protein [Paenibacillus sp. TAB 01]|uniref:ATP-binding protein n=1 Tax=Paenibacillus sp. TAB 01 TaxID=3368988 RepID=UPI003751D301